MDENAGIDITDSMSRFLVYHRRMVGVMTGLSLAAAALLLAFMRPGVAWAGGFAAGALAQLLKFTFIDVAIIKKIAVMREKAASTQLKGSFFSLMLFGAAVAAVFTLDWNVWAMAAGIFLPRIVLIVDSYLRPNPFGNQETVSGAAPAEDYSHE